MGRVVVDLDQQSVGTGSHGAHGQGIYQPALAGGMAGIDDDGQVGQLPQHGDAGQIQGVAGVALKGADTSLAEDHILIAAGHDVLGAHQPLLVGGGHAPFDHDGFVLMAYGLE